MTGIHNQSSTPGVRVKPRPRVRLDVAGLYRAVDVARQHDGLDWKTLGQLLNINPGVFSRMASGGRPSVDALTQILDWLGVSLATFTMQAQPDMDTEDNT